MKMQFGRYRNGGPLNLFERRKRPGQKTAGNKRKTCPKTVIRGDIYVYG